MLQALLINFVYSRRTEAIYAQGREAPLQLHEEKEKLAAKLNESSSKADLSSEIVEMATASLRRSKEHRRGHDEEVAKLWEELDKERASRIEAAARFKEELNKARMLQEKAWKTLEDERRLRKGSF